MYKMRHAAAFEVMRLWYTYDITGGKVSKDPPPDAFAPCDLFNDLMK